MADKMPDWNKMNLEKLRKQAAALWEQLQKKKSASEKITVGLFFAGMGMALWAIGTVSDRLEKRGKMMQAEWKLKYDNHGQPRPEYWSGRTLTEQAEELSWVKALGEEAKKEKQEGRAK